MSNLKQLKNRLESIQTTKKITQAMNMVASSKFQKAQKQLLKLRVYNEKIKSLISNTLSRSSLINHPLLNNNPTAKELLVVIGSDRGLCGSFNNTIIKYLNETDLTNKDIIAVGTKIVRAIKKNPQANLIAEHHNFFEEISLTKANNFAENIKNYFLKNKYPTVSVVYISFRNALSQNLTVVDLLPLKNILRNSVLQKEKKDSDFVYEPDKTTFINNLFSQYLTTAFLTIFNESFTSEQGARMTAMDSATENANQMNEELSTIYNRVRQTAITTELTEITAGVEANN